MRKSISVVIFVFVLLAFCPSLAAQTNLPIYLYSLEDSGVDHGPLRVFSVNTTSGALTEVPGSPFAAGLGPSQIVVDPSGRFVYVINSNSNDITGFSVAASTGTLTPLPGSPFPTGANPITLTVDPTGRFLYVYAVTVHNSFLEASNIYLYTIDSATGVLSAALGSPISEPDFITSIVLAPNGNDAFLAETSTAPTDIFVDSVDFASGLLTTVGGVSPKNNSTQIVGMDPTGKFLYSLPGGATNGSVNAFAFDPSLISLTEVQGSPYSTGILPMDLEFDPSGKFLYVVNTNSGYESGIPASDYDGSVSAFAIDSETGGLTPVSGSPFAAGINPISMVVDPTDHFAYSASTTYTTGDLGFATILGYTVNSSSGALTPFSGTPWVDSLMFSAGNRLAISYAPAAASGPLPMISSLSPSSATAGAAGFTLQVNGLNFVQGSTVYFGGQARSTVFVSATQLDANILSGDLANGGTAVVFVFNPLPGGGASTSIGFAVSNPSPTISTINPISVVSGSAFTLTANGSSFVTGSTVNINGSGRATTFVTSTQLTAAILASDVAIPGAAGITVINPANGVAGGGTSSPVTLTILPNNTQPTVGTLIPASVTAGAAAFTLTVAGSGFVPSSQISFNLTNVPTTFVSSAALQASIPASAIAFAGNPLVIVTNPGGVVSVVTTFAVNNLPPGGGSVSPPSISAGTAALTLNVIGTNFIRGSVVLVGGSSRVTVYVNSTLLQATLLPTDLSHGGTLNITIMNPPPGGGTSSAISFSVADYSVTAPTAPTSVNAGEPATFALAVAPSNGTFTNPVTFTVSPLPAGASATFSPSATIIPVSATQTVTLSISTTTHSSVLPPAHSRWPLPLLPFLYVIAALFGWMMLGGRYSRGRNSRLAPQLLLGSMLVIVAYSTACGGAGSAPTPTSQVNQTTGTPAGTYMITVTATSGSAVHTSTVTLTVI